MLAGDAEDRPGAHALGEVADALEVLGDHEQLGQVLRGGLAVTDELDELLLDFTIKGVDAVVLLDDLLRGNNVGGAEGSARLLDHRRGDLRHLADLGLDLLGGLGGDVLHEEADVTRHAVDVGEVGHDAEGAGDEAQVLADERLLEQHHVEAVLLDGVAQAVLRLAAGHDALGGALVARRSEAGGAHVGGGLLGQTVDVVLDVVELLGELGTGSCGH